MVNVGKLWGDARFAWLDPHSKLLYLYLISQPSISTLGVLEIDREKIDIDLKLKGSEFVGFAIEELRGQEFLIHIEEERFDVFIIKKHFLSLSKSKLNIRKAIDEGKSSRYQKQLRELYTPDDFKPPLSFTPPTPEEATNYALTLGYVVNGHTFVDYYASNDWYNKNNKKVRSWRLTLERVWCREENKLTFVDGAPSGYDYFHITLDNGDRVSPEGWRNGIPTHGNYLHEELLIQEFNECTTK